MKKSVIRYTLIILVVVVVAIYLGSMYMYKQNTETGDSGDSVETSVKEYTLPANIGKKTGPHGAYDPHAALTPEKHIQVALQHKQEGRLSEAMRTLTMAILQHGENKDLYAVRGSLYLEQGQPTEALRDLEKALKLAPDDSELLTNRAQVYRQFG
ncbi:MAG: tetratricopeptide repeat protein, partial [Gammaproteobacteria bacterium]|nr:tetratricopeptide repeat protein [Gammaproteobacteria bacterium]